MTTKARKTARWTEAASCGSALRIDREAGIIRDVKILGYESTNGREYTRDAVAKSKPLYEGAKVYSNHQRDPKNPERKNEDRWGKLQNTNIREDGLYGDLQYLKTHRDTEAILESIERFQDTGLSHDAGGEYKTVRGKQIVESITKVYSVDLVQNPATNRNLFESETPTVTKRKVLAVLREHASMPLAARLLARMVEMSDVYSPEMEMEDASDAAGEAADPQGEIDEAFKAAVSAIVDSTSLSTDDKIAKIKMLLDTKDQLAESNGKETAEQVKHLQEQVTALQAEKALRESEAAARATEASCKQLLESLKREPTDIRIKTLAACAEADRKQVAESWPELVSRPAVSASAFKESMAPDEDYKPAATTEDLRKRLGV